MASRVRLVDVRPGERAALVMAFAYHFTLLTGWYVVKPVRDMLGVSGGVNRLPWLFTVTFVTMLGAVPIYSALVARRPRRQVIPIVYRFFILNLVGFWALLRFGSGQRWIAVAFFAWGSVFSLFVVSVFRSMMADMFTPEAAKRLFGVIAAGGTAGGLAGPALGNLLVEPLGPSSMLLVSAAFLAAAVECVRWLTRWSERSERSARSEPGRVAPVAAAAGDPVGGGMLAGLLRLVRSPYLLGIAGGVLLFAFTSTVLYFQQAGIVTAALASPKARTLLFARIDLGVNLVALAVQLSLTGFLLTRAGLLVSVTLVPALTAIGFLVLGAFPALAVLVAVQGIRRAVHYAVDRPAGEVLFTVVPREDKYKAKNVIDTVVYRGGDTVASWAYGGMAALGLGLPGTALAAVPVAVLWASIMVLVARSCERRTREVNPCASLVAPS
jgi:ATP:ADP antiporter, AAA family